MTIPEKTVVFSPQAKAAIVAKFNSIKNILMQSSAGKDPSELAITLQTVSDMIMELYEGYPEVEEFAMPWAYEESEGELEDLPSSEQPPP